MKTFLTFIPFTFLSMTAMAQEPRDVLFFTDGTIDSVQIIAIESEVVQYAYPGENIPISTPKARLQKVVTRSGREVMFENTSIQKSVFTILDWEKVDVTGVDQEVLGLKRIDNVSAKAKGWTTYTSLEKMQSRAMAKMKMQAAFMGCDLVYLLSQRNEDVRYGSDVEAAQPASSSVSGMAYASTTVRPDNVESGVYVLDRVISLYPNHMTFKERNVGAFERTLTINKENFRLNDDYFEIIEFAGIEHAENRMRLIQVSENGLVFLVISRNRAGKMKYYNLFYRRA